MRFNSTLKSIKNEIIVSLSAAATVAVAKHTANKIKKEIVVEGLYHGCRYGYNFAFDWIYSKTNKFDHLKTYISSQLTMLPIGNYSFNLDKFTKMEFAHMTTLADGSTDMVNYISYKFIGLNAKKYQRELTLYIDIKGRSGKIKSADFKGLMDLPNKTFDDIVCPNKNTIINYLDTWVNNKDYYNRHHISYKGGILLYGPKGGGKTSMVQAIANYLNYSVIVVSPNSINALRGSNISNSIILLEDIDCYIGKRDESINDDNSNTMNIIGDMLNVLDGIASYTEVIFIATTNYIDRIDDAITRSGRFDCKVELPLLDKELAIELVEKLEANPDEILKDIEYPIAASDIQSKVLTNLNKFKGEI